MSWCHRYVQGDKNDIDTKYGPHTTAEFTFYKYTKIFKPSVINSFSCIKSCIWWYRTCWLYILFMNLFHILKESIVSKWNKNHSMLLTSDPSNTKPKPPLITSPLLGNQNKWTHETYWRFAEKIKSSYIKTSVWWGTNSKLITKKRLIKLKKKMLFFGSTLSELFTVTYLLVRSPSKEGTGYVV